MADLPFRLSTLTLLVEHLLVTAFVTAIVIVFALATLLEALKAYVTLLGALELGLRVGGIVRTLVTAAIFSILVHATGLASWEARCASALLNLTEAKAAISITLAFLVRQGALFADFVVWITGVSAALPEGATKIGAGRSSGNTLISWLKCKWLMGSDNGHGGDAGNNTFHLIKFINYLYK